MTPLERTLRGVDREFKRDWGVSCRSSLKGGSLLQARIGRKTWSLFLSPKEGYHGASFYYETPRLFICLQDAGRMEPDEEKRLKAYLSLLGRSDAELEACQKPAAGAAAASGMRLLRRGDVGDSANLLVDSILRVTFRCNQRCPFCFVDLSGAHDGLPEIERRLDELRALRAGSAVLTISGGEPTTHPRLAEIVALARAKGFQDIRLQTNAVRLADPSLLPLLGEAEFFVSFHSNVPRIYDRLTGSRGHYPLALQGIRNILSCASSRLVFNCLVNRLNAPLLAGYVRFIDRLAGRRRGKIGLFFSMMNEVGLSQAPDLGIGLTELSGSFNHALRLCRERGIDVGRFAGDCAFPPCVLDAPEEHAAASPQTQEGIRRAADFAGEDPAGRAKSPACSSCCYDLYCRGVSVVYAQRFGLEALKPVRASKARPILRRIRKFLIT